MGTSVRSSPSIVVREQRGKNNSKWLILHQMTLNVQNLPSTFMTLKASPMDMFYLGDCLRGLNLNPTLKMIDKLGGAKKKGEKFIKLEEFYPIYSDVKKSKDTGSFEDFIECLKLY